MPTRGRKDRRENRSRIALAALALLGIGAAITTAAWTDQVWFSTDAQAATLNLQGSSSISGPWNEHETEGDALIIPIESSGFGDIVPNSGPITTEVFVKNASSIATDISLDTTTTGALFSADSTVTVTAKADTTSLAPNEVATIEIAINAGEIPAAYQGESGTVILRVSSSTQ